MYGSLSPSWAQTRLKYGPSSDALLRQGGELLWNRLLLRSHSHEIVLERVDISTALQN